MNEQKIKKALDDIHELERRVSIVRDALSSFVGDLIEMPDMVGAFSKHNSAVRELKQVVESLENG